MNNETLVLLLEEQLKQAESQAPEIYKIRLKRTIGKLKEGLYLNKEEELVIDLESIGFMKEAREVRTGVYK